MSEQFVELGPDMAGQGRRLEEERRSLLLLLLLVGSVLLLEKYHCLLGNASDLHYRIPLGPGLLVVYPATVSHDLSQPLSNHGCHNPW